MPDDKIFADEALEGLRRKYFPRIPWTEQGPLRRRYLTRPAQDADAIQVLTDLAAAQGFIEPGQHAVTGDAGACLAAFQARVRDRSIALIFGTELSAHWCDLALGPADPEGWRELIVRSEEAENLTALAHAVGVLKFRRAP